MKVDMKILVAVGALALLTFGSAAGAQEPSLVGSWRGFAQGLTFNLVIGADGSYSEQAIAGSLMTLQQGHIQVVGPGMITFIVEDWEPKTQPVYHPTGTVGGYYTDEPVAKPPGGTWRIQFTSPDSFTMEDVNFGGVIVFNRVP
jgi:hypothetical protein